MIFHEFLAPSARRVSHLCQRVDRTLGRRVQRFGFMTAAAMITRHTNMSNARACFSLWPAVGQVWQQMAKTWSASRHIYSTHCHAHGPTLPHLHASTIYFLQCYQSPFMHLGGQKQAGYAWCTRGGRYFWYTPIYFLRYDKFGERLFNAAIGVQCSILGDTRSNFKKNILPSVTLYKDDFK